MMEEDKVQTPKRPRTKKKKGGSKTTSQPVDETQPTDELASAAGADKTASSCTVRPTLVSVVSCVI